MKVEIYEEEKPAKKSETEDKNGTSGSVTELEKEVAEIVAAVEKQKEAEEKSREKKIYVWKIVLLQKWSYPIVRWDQSKVRNRKLIETAKGRSLRMYVGICMINDNLVTRVLILKLDICTRRLD